MIISAPFQHISKFLFKLIFITAVYVVAGKLSLLLAIPPGYVTAIWPASGFALAALLCCGYRYWPGVWLGSFIINFSVRLDPSYGLSFFQIALISAIMGSGAALQACFGAFLVKRYTAFPTQLDNNRDILGMLLLGGAAACLVNATISATTLLAAGSITIEYFPFTWWAWWVGDTLGVFIFTPLVILWTSESQRKQRHRLLYITIPLALTFTVIVGAFCYADSWEQNRLKLEFEKKSNQIALEIAHEVEKYTNNITSLQGFYKAFERPSQREFHLFTEFLFQELPAIQAISYAPRIYDKQRKDLTIYEKNAKGENIVAASRPEYFPITYLEPTTVKQDLLNVDIATDTAYKKAMDQAIAAGELRRLSTPYTLDIGVGENIEVMLLPIYAHEVSIQTLEERIQALQGFVITFFSPAKLISQALLNKDINGVQYIVFDLLPNQEKRAIFGCCPANTQYLINEMNVSQTARKLNSVYKVNVAGCTWQIETFPTKDYFYSQRTWDPWFVLATGLFFTAMVWAFLLILTGDAAHIEWMSTQLNESEKNLINALNTVNRKSQLLQVISSEKALYTTLDDSQPVFDSFLKHLMHLTESPYGFIAEVHYDDNQQPYLRVNAIMDKAWGEYLRNAFEGRSDASIIEFHRTDTIITRPLTGEVVMGNDLDKEGKLETFTKREAAPSSYVDMPLFAREMLISKDLDKESLLDALSHGDYSLSAYCGMPLHAKDNVVGVAAVANCPKGYKEDLYDFLSPLLQAISHLIVSNKSERLRKTVEDTAIRYQEELEELRKERNHLLEQLSILKKEKHEE